MEALLAEARPSVQTKELTMNYCYWGFFSELGYPAPNDGLLAEALKSKQVEEKDRILKYLRSGVIISRSPGVDRDVLNNQVIPEPPTHRSDGVWVWPSAAAFYVEKYGLVPPDNLVATMRQNHWQVPELSADQVRNIGTDLRLRI